MTDEIREAIEALVFSADGTGCTDDLTVVSAEAVERLHGLLNADAEAAFEEQDTADRSRFADAVEEFRAYCGTISDRQVEGVIEKESEFADSDPFRAACLEVALQEAANRELDV